MTPETLISVIIRTKNRPDLLKEAVDSVVLQTYRPLEVVIVNDGGCELPVFFSEELDQACIQFKYLENKQSEGRSAAANKGLFEATGELAVFLDEDDYFLPEHIDKLFKSWTAEGKDHACVYSATKVVSGPDSCESKDIISAEFSQEKLVYGNFLPIHSVLFPLCIRDYNIRFDEGLNLYEDWDFWLQVSQLCSFRHIKDATCVYRVNLSQSGVHDRQNKEKNYLVIYEKWLKQEADRNLMLMLAKSHQWLEDSILDLQKRNQLQLDEIGEKHSFALAMIDAKDDDIKHLESVYQDAINTIKDKDKDVDHLNAVYRSAISTIEEKDSSIKELEKLYAHAISVIEEKDENIKHLDRLYTHATDVIAEKDADIEALQLISAEASGEEPIVSHETKKSYVHQLAVKSKTDAALLFLRDKLIGYRKRAFESKMELRKIDVIIPVYRGLEDTRDCIESVISSTTDNKTPFELIVIDDKSPEEEVSQYLVDKSDQGFFRLIKNEENLGFVATVNKGMSINKDRDVILLNSDTVVANDWIDRIANAAYKDDSTGTVTPFSNNATICSYPDFCQDNELPAHTTLGQLDKIFSAANHARTCSVPTGVGFCMYIRRDCLNQVGYFDVDTFGKGYGEENDFCQRALKQGWSNQFALDVFVQHTGNVSFGDSHNEQKHAALEKLAKLHPDYEFQVQKHIQDDPAKDARMRAWLSTLYGSGLPVLLHVSHNRGGGTQRFVKELKTELQDQALSLLLTPSTTKPGTLCLTEVSYSGCSQSTGEPEYALYFDIESQNNQLVHFLSTLPVAAVHYHHLIGHTDWIMQLATLLKKPWFVTIHDYYMASETITLSDDTGCYNGPADQEIADFNLDTSASGEFAHLLSRREHFRSFLEGATTCFTPSDDCSARMGYFFPSVSFKKVYHQRGKQLSEAFYPAQRSDAEKDSISVLVIGALGKSKGADLLESVACRFRKQGLKVNFELIGYAYRDLKQLPHSNLTVSGNYDEKQLGQIIKSRINDNCADIIWFPALWPETFSYTLSDAIESKLPIIAPDMGAFPERLYGRPYSWVVEQDIESITAIFNTLVAEGFNSRSLSEYISQVKPQDQAFSYAEDYQTGFAATQVNPIDPQKLSSWLSACKPFWDGKPTPRQKFKTRLLLALYKIKVSPLMRPITKRISPHMQTRIKSYFLQ